MTKVEGFFNVAWIPTVFRKYIQLCFFLIPTAALIYLDKHYKKFIGASPPRRRASN